MARAPIDDEPSIEDLHFPQVLGVIADPIRLSIVTQLASADAEISCGNFDLPVKASTATHHFTALRQAGIIHQYYVGTSRMNVLREADLEEAFPGFLPSVIAGARSSR